MDKSLTSATNVTLHPTILQFWRHIWRHTGEKPNKCSQCDYASPRAAHLRMHLKTHRREKCNQCNFVSFHSDDLRTHLKMHTKCNQCDYESSLKGNLKRHLVTHSDAKSHICSQCDYASSRKDHLKAHLKSHRKENPQKTDYAAIMHQLGFLWSTNFKSKILRVANAVILYFFGHN